MKDNVSTMLICETVKNRIWKWGNILKAIKTTILCDNCRHSSIEFAVKVQHFSCHIYPILNVFNEIKIF
jgi:hypothetical protein